MQSATISNTPFHRRALALALAAVFFLSSAMPASAGEAPAPLPPPPELADLDYVEATPSGTPDDVRAALAPLNVGAPTPAAPASPPVPATAPVVVAAPGAVYQPAPVYSAPVQTNVYADFTISPPSREMPAEYYNLPVEETAAMIPGVLLPEYDDQFHDPGYRPAPSVRARTTDGLSIRQLEPFFALAKGSEAAALEARGRGDEFVYHDQIEKAVAAYMSIIDMSDAMDEAREEAWYGVARCEYRRGNWWSAFDALERSFPKKFDRPEVAGRIKLEMYIGERLWRLGTEPAPMAIVDGKQLNGYQAASAVYDKAIFNQPTANDAPLALLRRGDAAALEEKWEDAERHYRQVVEYYPESDPAMQARSSLATVVLRRQWPRGMPELYRGDVSKHMDDVERSHERLSPEAEERRQQAVELANNMEAETRLRQAKDYLRNIRLKKSRDAGVFLLGEIVSRYPTTAHAREAADLLRGMGLEPPVALSDGTRFPYGGSWMPEDEDGDFGRHPAAAGGWIGLEGQDDMSGATSPGLLPPSPSREVVYEAIPGIVGE